MKKIYLFVNLIILISFLFFTSPLFAQSTNLYLANSNNSQNTQNSHEIQILIELIKNLFSLFGNTETTHSAPLDDVFSPQTLSPTFTYPKINDQPPSKNFVYYPQCGGRFDNYPLPHDCNICKAGCGPTTVAMIIASLVNKNVNPITIVNYYGQKGYYLGCAGSRASDAKNTLSAYGLKTTDYLIYSAQTINQVASDFKGYLKAGWTLFALANYCNDGCGHFFWIVDLDDNNNVWAYDPYYGRKEAPPINENRYYPFPRYRLAFGVKK